MNEAVLLDEPVRQWLQAVKRRPFSAVSEVGHEPAVLGWKADVVRFFEGVQFVVGQRRREAQITVCYRSLEPTCCVAAVCIESATVRRIVAVIGFRPWEADSAEARPA